MMLEGLSLWLHFGKLKGLPHVVKYGTVIQHQCSGCSQVQVGPYFRGLPAVPPTPWPNSYGLTPYLVIWHGAHTGFRSNGLTCWVRGLVFVPFLWLASLIWGMQIRLVAVCNQTAQPPSPSRDRHNREPGGNLFPSAHGQQPGVHYRARDRPEAASRA